MNLESLLDSDSDEEPVKANPASGPTSMLMQGLRQAVLNPNSPSQPSAARPPQQMQQQTSAGSPAQACAPGWQQQQQQQQQRTMAQQVQHHQHQRPTVPQQQQYQNGVPVLQAQPLGAAARPSMAGAVPASRPAGVPAMTSGSPAASSPGAPAAPRPAPGAATVKELLDWLRPRVTQEKWQQIQAAQAAFRANATTDPAGAKTVLIKSIHELGGTANIRQFHAEKNRQANTQQAAASTPGSPAQGSPGSPARPQSPAQAVSSGGGPQSQMPTQPQQQQQQRSNLAPPHLQATPIRPQGNGTFQSLRE
eukprot:CAMPEP_0206152066 /NCGR_PEP_ID=MMETSP1473-20131121/39139_1 /ASSEMBLY_ACC=CAM_ASM_001109 /TAXON_ID=1461547 /ORGANISM="Stichococcus sp, Strain RCC1054" /LENGTH=306 /DNA_ID=CAMNT_0053549619 /DNA_START=437 /DNA_END=1354 /DNA_ORIENTATION=-